MNITIQQGTTDQIKTLFENVPTYTEKDQSYPYYTGFDLMSPTFFEHTEPSHEHGCRYLVALNQQNEPIGVLKTKRYGLPLHEFVPEEKASAEDSYVAIRLIDVREDVQRFGVARQLIQYWSESVLRPNDVIVGGSTTPKGLATDIHHWIDRETTQRYEPNELMLVDDWLIAHDDLNQFDI